MPGRSANPGLYRYGFNGMEQDDEVKGPTNSLDFGARIYDPRLGRWLSVDPLFQIYPEFSPYGFSGNSPIMYRDIGGEGFNGGFSIENQSSEPIIVYGTAATAYMSANGNTIDLIEDFSSRGLTLDPGQRLETYVVKKTNSDGSYELSYESRVVQFATFDYQSGTLETMEEEIILNDGLKLWDIDFIQVQDGQVFESENGKKYDNDPSTPFPSPSPETGPNTIKLQPGLEQLELKAWDKANDKLGQHLGINLAKAPDPSYSQRGSITISGNKNGLKLESSAGRNDMGNEITGSKPSIYFE